MRWVMTISAHQEEVASMKSINNKPENFKQEDMTTQILFLDSYVKHCAQEVVATHSVEHGV